ncbi:MAG: DNA-directed RNA polymerase subunit omega [Muricoprocola sp.]
MLHPSYTELIKVINSEAENSDTPVINSRYSLVLATAKRARQIIDGKEPMSMPKVDKPLSIAVDELNKGLLKIVGEDAPEEEIADEADIQEDVLEDMEENEEKNV